MSNPQSGTLPALLPGTAAALRSADLLLRAAGGRSVLLRLPAPAVAADASEQLGLATPQFQDSSLAPVVFRKARATVSSTSAQPVRWELLVSASAVAQLAGTQAGTSASALFASAFGVLVDDTLYEILSVTASQVFGQAYLYRLVLQAPQSQIT